jgi:peptidyl-prolyl isomerase E (cyclophilin E)
MIDEDDYRRTIYVGNLPETVTEQMIQAFFSPFGHIKDVKIPIDHVSERMRGYAFVEFDEREDAVAAIDNYDQTEFLERTIRVRKSKPVDMKPNYQDAVWRNDDWLQKIERAKLENEKYTQEEQAKARALGLPIFKDM